MKNLRLIILVLAMLALPLCASAAQVAAKAEVSRTEVAKGETFSYKLSIISEGQAGTPAQLSPPDFTGFDVTGRFQTTSVKVIEGKQRSVTELELRMSSDLPGEHLISPARVVLTDPATGKQEEIKSNPVKVTVLEKGPGLMKGIEEDIKDIKAPKSFMERVRLFFYGLMFLVALVFIALLGLALYMVKRRKEDKRPTVPAPIVSAPLSAHEEVLEALRLAEGLRADPKAFYTAVIEAIRIYLKKKYDIPATEATTTEIMAEARKSSLPADARDRLWALLGEADLVKFAKHVPTEEEKSEFIEKAKALVKTI